jgi:tetratricopeptide (TPR) repeat protein
VDSAGRRHTVQLHLKSALAARDAGDIQLALQEVDAALSIDPDYLAARMLRRSIADPKAAPSPPQSPRPEAPPAQPEQPPVEPVRHRQIMLRISAAETAILLGRFAEARAALDELAGLDPALPAIPELEAEFEAARIRTKRKRLPALPAMSQAAHIRTKRKPLPALPALSQAARIRTKRKRLMLAVGVAAGVVGAVAGARVGRVTPANRQIAPARPATAPLVTNAVPMFNVGVPDAAPTLSAGLFEPAETATPGPAVVTHAESAPLRPAASATPRRARVETPAPPGERVSDARFVERSSAAAVVEHPSADPVAVERVPEASPTVARGVVSPATGPPAYLVDDPALIRDALQRYRRAYNALDARLAHAVYPGVDETALTHAFEGLRSQALEFEACSVDSFGASARAVCRGQARYVTKIGSREPRLEPRVWTFRLRKDNGDWTIESAWTNR